MFTAMKNHLKMQLDELERNGLYKNERILISPQQATITLQNGKKVLNLCANNYLGLANHPGVVDAAEKSFRIWGYGLSSVRFICGTQAQHRVLEQKLSAFLGMEETILYSSCFDANTGLFETILGEEDAIISDELNHASIIDGIRLCKAQRFRYKASDMSDLEVQLLKAGSARFRLIATDGVFSMDGAVAKLKEICDLAEKYDALVMVDDSHAVGFMGECGKGTHEYCGVMGRIDIITGTLGKALGGASGGYTSGRKEIIDYLRQRSRPYLFSNTLAPVIVATSLTVLDLLSTASDLRQTLMENTAYFRKRMTEEGFAIIPGVHPIVPIMLGDAGLSQQFAARMVEKGVYVVGFFFPVVQQGKARIRTQISAVHSRSDLDFAINAFVETRKEMGIK
jgi:glycine C-acetyltransferase